MCTDYMQILHHFITIYGTLTFFVSQTNSKAYRRMTVCLYTCLAPVTQLHNLLGISELLGIGSDLSLFCFLWGCSAKARSPYIWQEDHREIKVPSVSINMKTRIVHLEQIGRPSSSKCERRGWFNDDSAKLRATFWQNWCHLVLVLYPSEARLLLFCSFLQGWSSAGPSQLFAWTLEGGVLNSEWQFPKPAWVPKPVRLLEVHAEGGP